MAFWLLASCLAPPAPLASSAPMAPSAPVAFGFYGSYSSSSLVLFSFSLHMQSKIVIIASKQNYYCNEKIFRKEGRQAGRKEASRSKKILLGSKRIFSDKGRKEGKERKGKEKGKERKKERKGKEREGKERKGKRREGKGREGKEGIYVYIYIDCTRIFELHTCLPIDLQTYIHASCALPPRPPPGFLFSSVPAACDTAPKGG